MKKILLLGFLLSLTAVAQAAAPKGAAVAPLRWVAEVSSTPAGKPVDTYALLAQPSGSKQVVIGH